MSLSKNNPSGVTKEVVTKLAKVKSLTNNSRYFFARIYKSK